MKDERADELFALASSGLQLHCPQCANEMVGDDRSLTLAESPRGAMMECGQCGEISQWRFDGTPLRATQVPVTWGGTV